MTDYKKIIESFIRALIGAVAASVPTVLFNSTIISVISLGVGGVLGELVLPHVLHGLQANRLRNLFVLLVVTLLFTGGGFELFMRYDFYEYEKGDLLTIVCPTPTVLLRPRPTFESIKDDKKRLLRVGQQVIYLTKFSRKEFKFPQRDDGMGGFKTHFLVAFWRKVRTKDGAVGWVYGAYVQAK